MTSTFRRALPLLALAAMAPIAACGPAEEEIVDETPGQCPIADDDNLFAATEACAEDPKADTGYVTNLDAREVELTLEGDVAAAYGLERAPLASGQFALTNMRQKMDVYIQSLAEDFSDGSNQIEWKVGTAWKKWSAMSATDRVQAKRFRLTVVNAVVLNASRHDVKLGKTWSVPVPLKPTNLFDQVQRKCEGGDGHIQASNDVYWYVWEPTKSGCNAEKTNLTATVSKVLPKGGTVYPEYDKLFADKTLDVIVFWGQVEDGALSPSDYAFSLITKFERSLTAAGFKKVTATKGLRYQRVKSGITANIDIYSPREFSGLGDYANKQNFFDAVNSHELVVFNGHSMLGASDFWADSRIYRDPSKYQIFLYNGCLGYAYYVMPILDGKKDPANVDVVSNVVETPFAIMEQVTSTSISLMLSRAERGGTSSWQTIISKMNALAKQNSWYGQSFYGVSGARTNTYRPPR